MHDGWIEPGCRLDKPEGDLYPQVHDLKSRYPTR